MAVLHKLKGPVWAARAGGQADSQVRINAQLVDATIGGHLWSERYDRPLTDIFALQDEIVQRIVGDLKVKMEEAEIERVRRTPTENLTAYDAFLRGMEYARRLTKEGNTQARQMLERAAELDPNYASIDAVHGNPSDGAMLKPALAQVKKLTGVRPQAAVVDKGFRGQRYHPQAVAVYLSGRRNLAPRLGKLLKRRAAIEPVIGHTKHDHRMERNSLLGTAGDRSNVLLSGCAWNLKKLWRYFVEHPLQSCLT